VSLRQLDPTALLKLRVTGECTVTIPEWLFDRDCPGHYMRRIKTVSVSIPSVVGPYTSVNCTLTLQRSTIRTSPLLANGTYARDTTRQDDRFADHFGSLESIVTSGGSNDAGLFEANLHDERFLPFEGAGAISTWSLALPSQLRAFDYRTISDVILHVRYTARDAGPQLAQQATKELVDALNDAGSAGLALLLSLKHDFPSEWIAFVNGTGDLAIPLQKVLFPYLAQSTAVSLDELRLYAQTQGQLAQVTVPVPEKLSDELNAASGVSIVTLPVDGKVLTRSSDAEAFLLVRYRLER
jgi:hypothetical protein